MLFRDKRLLCALGLTLAQQLLLALSTYCIAKAGTALAQGHIGRVLRDISLFFSLALAAYVTSSMAAFATTRAANHIWKEYANATLSSATASLQCASQSNRRSMAPWLGGEALPTIGHACNLSVELLSASLNILFTLAVFLFAVGWQIASAMAAALVLSFALVMVLRRRIESTAGEMQQRRQRMLVGIEPAWDRAMFGTPAMRASGFCTLEAKMQRYFGALNRYVLLEQVLACSPIIISTLALIALLQFTDLFTASIAGALVALLPRSLQVFGNVHSLSGSLSQLLLVRARLRNLAGFCAGLERFRMHELPLQAISVEGVERTWAPAELLEALGRKGLTHGRFTVTGANGAGKSSFLKAIKEMAADALLLNAETSFLEADSSLSTGQRRVKEIENALSMAPTLLMLDEWDANLDGDNCRKIDQLLDEASRKMVVIEVRHLRPEEHSSTTSILRPGRAGGLRRNGRRGVP